MSESVLVNSSWKLLRGPDGKSLGNDIGKPFSEQATYGESNGKHDSGTLLQFF